nr:MAG TPA: hypothetical protein [Caudoviricetes sp.]
MFYPFDQQTFQFHSNSLTVELNTNRHWTLRKTLSL